jgi:hypothetical protein
VLFFDIPRKILVSRQPASGYNRPGHDHDNQGDCGGSKGRKNGWRASCEPEGSHRKQDDGGRRKRGAARSPVNSQPPPPGADIGKQSTNAGS